MLYLDAAIRFSMVGTLALLALLVGVSQFRTWPGRFLVLLCINQRLECRNFSTYVNSYRIASIKDALQSPEMRDIPILTIALDNGFNSLPPFNKAFKQSEGVTLRVYRAQKLNTAESF